MNCAMGGRAFEGVLTGASPTSQTGDSLGRSARWASLPGSQDRASAPSKQPVMPFESLSAFARALRAAGELATIDALVDPKLEIAEISDRVVKAGGPALLFRNVRGSRFPVLTNQFGTERRAAMAFGATSL